MVLNYFPLGFNKVDIFFDEIGYTDKNNQLNVLINTMDDNFCTFRDKDDIICGKRIRKPIIKNCCKKHLLFVNPELYKKHKKTYYTKKNENEIYYCISTSRRNDRCRNKVKNRGDLCSRHKKNTICFGSINVKVEKNVEKINTNNVCLDKVRKKNKDKEVKEKKYISIPLSFSNNIEFNYNNNYHITFGNIDKKEYNFLNQTEVPNTDKISRYDYTINKINKINKIENDNIINNDKEKIINYYEKIKKVELYIKSNKEVYISEKYKNKRKYIYYNENDVRKLFTYLNKRYNMVLEDLYNYGKNNCFEFLDEYKNDIDKLIIKFYETSNTLYL